MNYRINRRTKDEISVIGMGTGYIADIGDEAVNVFRRAYDGGVNFYDLSTGRVGTYKYVREALGDVRKNIMFQVQFGNSYVDGNYARTTDAERIKRCVEWQLQELDTDCIDYGVIHCIDEIADWEAYQKNGALRLLMDMQAGGIVKHIGLSSHTPATVQKIMDTVPVDMLMFSINPAFDYHNGAYGKGSVDERNAVYKRCAAEGIGISVMKPYAGGQLLDHRNSPFGQALTVIQCIQYALDRPGVLTVLPGFESVKQVEQALYLLQASEKERDYSVIATFQPSDAVGKCVYCNHCQPCPAGLDIGNINKFFDLTELGDGMAAEHYKALSKHAGDCMQCGVCNERCPFGVDQMGRMKRIHQYFLSELQDGLV